MSFVRKLINLMCFAVLKISLKSITSLFVFFRYLCHGIQIQFSTFLKYINISLTEFVATDRDKITLTLLWTTMADPRSLTNYGQCVLF